ncbi:ABC transporter permease subunit [Virgibacillus sp. 179-BFC.A HS]|uniref:ABC transporter permease subunit n=1 Tax=Tigheibacillus jepli TaxID=3035914 RepID=A0ABU5CF44_9BACI|nr:ABC transporter permease subunit [Virgibacillus sp. 179-BFC.A HS]MDY0404459.1 ABC transporter permease subunit [Virgibacillus sp. 179-BFC.A HS]
MGVFHHLDFHWFFYFFYVGFGINRCYHVFAGKSTGKNQIYFFLGESIPDVLVIGLTMVGVVFIYKHTDMLVLEIVANNGEKIYALPIIVLALIPTMLLYRIMMYDFEEEASKLYTDIAKSKGLTTGKILFSHIFRNAMIHIFLHAKSMLAFLLSNLLIVEYVFNLDGLMGFMFDHFSPEILTVGMLSIFVPAYVLQAIGQIIIEKKTGRQVEV